MSSRDGWQPGQVQRELGRVRRAAPASATVDLRLPDVRALLADRLAGRPTRANFRTGTLTVCTMVPMRSVPHRVVCLLGLDDGVFPRQGSVDGDDVLARDPMTGERDARSEDRQLLLDAILAATQTLVITYTGANEFSGQPRPPAVPLGEVLDALDATAATADGRSVSEAVTVRHPLQPFDAEERLARTAWSPETTFSFDTAAAAGARAAAGTAHAAGPLPRRTAAARLHADDVSLADLVRFWSDPVKGFLGRDGVDVALRRRRGPARGRPAGRDRQPRPVGGRRPGARRPAGRPRRGRRQAARVAAWGAAARSARLADARADPRPRRATSAGGRGARASTPRAVDVAVDLGGGRRLVGTVPEVYGDRLVPVTYSRLGAKHRLASVGPAAGPGGVRRRTAAGPPTRSAGPTAARATTTAASLLGPLDHTAARPAARPGRAA